MLATSHDLSIGMMRIKWVMRRTKIKYWSDNVVNPHVNSKTSWDNSSNQEDLESTNSNQMIIQKDEKI